MTRTPCTFPTIASPFILASERTFIRAGRVGNLEQEKKTMEETKQSATGYVLYNQSRKAFMLNSISTNRHDTWQAATAGGNTRAELVRVGWKCVPCTVSI
jgi:hypothetical protein